TSAGSRRRWSTASCRPCSPTRAALCSKRRSPSPRTSPAASWAGLAPSFPTSPRTASTSTCRSNPTTCSSISAATRWSILSAAALWLQGSNNLDGRPVPSPDFNGLLSFQTPRIQFVQPGLPRRMADDQGFEFAPRINPDSSMAMGFVDQQVNASGPPAIVTFAGNTSARLTSAVPGDYFDNASVAHFSHVIEDLYQFYSLPGQDPRHSDGEPFTERCQYMFRSNQIGTTNGIPAAGNTDQFTNGGGPAFVNNVFQGTGAAAAGAADTGGVFTPSNAQLNATFTG